MCHDSSTDLFPNSSFDTKPREALMYFTRLLYVFNLLLVVVIVVGCAEKDTLSVGSELPLSRTTFSFDQGTYPSDVDLFKDYRVQPGDELDILFQIRTWKAQDTFEIEISHTLSVKFVDVPEWNEEQLILPNGCISLPHLGLVNVVGKTIPELTAELEEKYSKILLEPDIYITVPEFRSRIKELKRDLHTAPRGLSRLVTVRPDGHVTFPLLGDFFVGQKTIPEVNTLLNKEYEEYLPGLHVDLFLQESSGSVVYIMGEVAKPGTYRTDRPITAFEALTKAGGFTNEARLKNIIVFRKHERKIIATRLNLKNQLTLKKNAAFFFLRPDDLVYVPRRKLASWAQTMNEIADVLMFNGWSTGYSLGDDVDWVGPNDPDDFD